MSVQKSREYETECLIELIAILLNKEPLPTWRREPNWGKIYKIADYHHVSNTIYSLLLAMDGKQLSEWKGRFQERFQFAVIMQERYQIEGKRVLKELEKHRIHVLEARERLITYLYERKENRHPETLRFLVEKGKAEQIHKIMVELHYEKRERKGYRAAQGENWYYHAGGVYIVFSEESHFTDKKMNRYFSIQPQKFPAKGRFSFLHEPDLEDLYLYQIAYMAEQFARGELEIRDLVDLWQYYLFCYERVDWKVLTKELKYLDLEYFSDLIIKLAAVWFGEITEYMQELPQLASMERYILSKGKEDRAENEEILPLIKVVADVYERDLKRERRREKRQLWLPPRDYMQAIYPVLTKTVLLLPLCWAHRILSSQYRKIRGWVLRTAVSVGDKGRKPIQKWKEKWNAKWEEKRAKNNDKDHSNKP